MSTSLGKQKQAAQDPFIKKALETRRKQTSNEMDFHVRIGPFPNQETPCFAGWGARNYVIHMARKTLLFTTYITSRLFAHTFYLYTQD